MAGYIAVDLDGTLAFYGDSHDALHVGEPIPAMVDRVKAWLAKGIEVRIFTARVSIPEHVRYVVPVIEAWCLKHIGRVLPVTCQKDYQMLRLYDDRAVQVEMNTGRLIGVDEE